ncbi:hypothetical protein EI167_05615 [Pseudoalteromonas prydzensis]|uniref:FixG C-terminal immunoglobulin-like domain-containing protein n=2 Tax=Pseudoalteromonas prydzensis TaxID=182141 RepID=A0ABR9FJD3_9GAMM|nr:hypothetical protein [Pseudoalteromonas prydzensis]
MVSMLTWLLQRTPIEVSVLRDRNALYRVNFEGLVENPYTLTIINKTQQLVHYRVAISGLDVAKLQSPQLTAVEAGQMKRIPVTVVADGYDLPNKLNALDFVSTAEEDHSIKASISSVFYRD